MNRASRDLDREFLQRQRERLMALRDELTRSTRTTAAEEDGISSQASGEAREPEEDAQRLTLLQVGGSLIAHDRRRLAQIDRALAKLEAGTYGLSDRSGQPIPRERLEVMPEATDALDD